MGQSLSPCDTVPKLGRYVCDVLHSDHIQSSEVEIRLADQLRRTEHHHLIGLSLRLGCSLRSIPTAGCSDIGSSSW